MTAPSVAACIWIVLLFAIGLVRGAAHQSATIKILLFPGFALESATRSIACLLSGTPIQSISPWQPGKPILNIGRSPIAHLGPPIYMLTRLTLAFIAILVCLDLLPEPPQRSIELDPDPSIIENLLFASTAMVQGLRTLPTDLQLSSGGSATGIGIIFMYVSMSYLIALGFSARELVAAAWGMVGLVALTHCGQWLGLRFGFLSRGQLIDYFYGEHLWSALSLLVELSCVTLCALTIARLIARVIPARRSGRKTRT